MINPRYLTALFLVAALGAMPLLAQTAAGPQAEKPAQPVPEKTAPAKQEPAAPEKAPTKTPSGAGKDSPFDYQSSEEISEDVPVSFPVDI